MKYIYLIALLLVTFSSHTMHYRLLITNKMNKALLYHYNFITTNNQNTKKESLNQNINNVIQNNIHQEKTYNQWKKELNILYKKHPQEIQTINTNFQQIIDQENINKLINKQKVYCGRTAFLYGALVPASAMATFGSGLFTSSYLLFAVLGDIGNSAFENLAHFFIGVPCASIITSGFALGTLTLVTLAKKNFNDFNTVTMHTNKNVNFIKKLLKIKQKKSLEKQKE